MKKWLALLLCLMLTISCCTAVADELPFLVRYGDRNVKQVALTIDDGYNVDYIRKAYDLSVQYNVPITFFMLGINIEAKDAELWRAIAASHNELGNHTYGHLSLPKQKRSTIYAQVMRTQAILDEVLGYHYPIQVFRPPYGNMNRSGQTHVNGMIQALSLIHI